MGYSRLSLIVAGLTLLMVWAPQDAQAAGAGAAAIKAGIAIRQDAARLAAPVLHRHRAQSFYCYPKNHWWFYRPYTTNYDGHPRCMPYFHYLGPGPRSQRNVK